MNAADFGRAAGTADVERGTCPRPDEATGVSPKGPANFARAKAVLVVCPAANTIADGVDLLRRVAVNRRSILPSLSLLFAVLLTACSGPSFSFRYRLTIEIETPQGLKSGSSVLETTIQDDTKVSWNPPEARLARRRTRGDAIAIDLGAGRYLVALLTTQPLHTGRTGTSVIVTKSFDLKSLTEIRTLSSSTRSAEVADLPVFIAISDIADPLTARVVDPLDFESLFGLGVRLRSARVAITQEGVTRSIRKSIPWIDDNMSIRKLSKALFNHELLPGENHVRQLLTKGDRFGDLE